MTRVRIAHAIPLTPGSDQPETTVEAEEVCGLLVYRLPDWVEPASPYRWRIGHRSGLVIAATGDEGLAHAGVAAIADRADWRADRETLNAAIAPAALKAMYADLRETGCYHPGSPMAAATVGSAV